MKFNNNNFELLKKIEKLYLLFFFIIFQTNIILINTRITSTKKNFIKINKEKRNLEIINKINNVVNIESINDKISYITSTKDENGDIYLLVNTEDSSSNKRLIYIIRANYTQENKLLEIDSAYHNKYPTITLINILNKTYIGAISYEAKSLEILDYIKSNTYYKEINTISNTYISKNTFTSLKYYNNKDYIINAYIDKDNNFLIQKIYVPNFDISSNDVKHIENNVGQSLINSSVNFFEFDNYIECLNINFEHLYTISIFNISDLDNVYQEVIDTTIINYQELYSKCIYFKNNVGAFIYFIDEFNKPKLHFKKLVINNNTYQLNNYIDDINIITINSIGAFSIKSNYIYNDFIKTSENNLFYTSTDQELVIYVIIIRLLNDDKNVLLSYYNIRITNDFYRFQIYKDLNLFSLNGLLGLGMTHFDLNLDETKTYSSFLIFGNLNFSDNININISDNINIFNEENKFVINIDKILEKVTINNNIFGYILTGIKIISYLNENELGFYIYSNNNNKIEQNQLIFLIFAASGLSGLFSKFCLKKIK